MPHPEDEHSEWTRRRVTLNHRPYPPTNPLVPQAINATYTVMSEDFKNSNEIETWLKTQPRDVICVFAARAALRVVPVLEELLGLQDLKRSPDFIILQSFYALTTSVSVGRWSDMDMRYAAAHAADAADDAATDAAVDAAAFSARAAVAAFSAADTVAIAATLAGTNIYRAYSVDRDFIEAGGNAQALSEIPLWPYSEMPEVLHTKWQALKSYLLNLNQDWDVWTDWYEDRLAGKPLIKSIEIGDPENGHYRRATFPPKAYENPAEVNAKIKTVIEDYWAG